MGSLPSVGSNVNYQVLYRQSNKDSTVKRPNFDTLFSENSAFSKICFSSPPSKFLEVCLNSEYM